MRKLIKILNILFLAVIILLIGFMLGRKYDLAIDENDNLVGLKYSANEQKIRRLVSLIDNQYMEEVNTDSLVDKAISQIVGQLDPHSNYLDKDEIQKVARDLGGSFEGLGIQIKEISDTITITTVLKEGKNYHRLFIGDKILKIDSIPIVGVNSENTQQLLKEEPSGILRLTIKRDNTELHIDAEKGEVLLPSVSSHFMINEDLGFIKLNRFAEHSAKEFHQALQDLKKKGMKSLVFDLRGNPGGLMNVAEEIADEFLKKNELIVYTQDKEEKRRYSYATSKGIFEDGKVYVLIDESSASASEIIAGALQEYGRATIIGRRSFGKGLVQREISLGDGTRVRLTVAHYYTPSGRSIQRPYDKGKKEYGEEIYRRIKNGELYYKDSIKVDKELAFKTPSGKIVYGGGGIVPDEFVAVDTARLKVWLLQHSYMEKNTDFFMRKTMQNRYNPFWMSEDLFLNHNDFSEIKEDFIKIIGINKERLVPEEEEMIETFIRSMLAEGLFGTDGFYKAWWPEDNMILRAIELDNES